MAILIVFFAMITLNNMTKELTHSEKLIALTDKIDSLLGGEIKELKFGCIINRHTCDGVETVLRMKDNNTYSFSATLLRESFGSFNEFDIDKSRCEVIGRPIMATDILRAFNIITKGIPVEIDSFDDDLFMRNFTTMNNATIMISLPLHSQPESTVAELYNLFFE